MSAWMQNVRLPPDSWGRIAAGSLAEPDSKAFLDHIRYLGTDMSDLTCKLQLGAFLLLHECHIW